MSIEIRTVCGRCGAKGDWKKNGRNYSLRKQQRFLIWCYGLSENIDLCPECYHDFIKFLVEKRKEEKE